MTDLTKQLAQALKFTDTGINWNRTFRNGMRHENDRLAPLHAALLKCVEALEFYGDKNNWNRDLNGWRHDIVEKDLDDETLNKWDGRFSGKRAREAIADIRKALEGCK